jgi:deazaflavin-dependent oxidoreductase (nitroreductase family)
MAKTYQVPSFVRLGNFFTTRLLRAGLKPGNMALLTVRGRKSGIPRTTPVSLVEYDEQRLLIGAFGEVDWVRNLRAAGEASLIRGPHPEHIFVKELSPEEAAPILKRSLAGAPGFLLKNFDATPESPLKDFEREALKHPVFLVKSEAEMQRGAVPGDGSQALFFWESI